MIHYNYSAHQLENEAEKLLTQFDPERLRKPKPIDVYAVIEKCLGVDYDWKYITPDQSILGATAFNALAMCGCGLNPAIERVCSLQSCIFPRGAFSSMLL